jgi:hypothetical protein
MKYSHLLDSAKAQCVILFDTKEQNQRAWLVPQLSVLLDLVNKFAYQRDPGAPIKFAEPIANGAAASELVLKDRTYANLVLRQAILEDERDERVADVVKAIYTQMSLRAELDAASERGARGTKEISRKGLLGWDLLELCNPPMVSKQRMVNIHRTHLDYELRVTPCWLPLAKQLPVYFGRHLGELIVPVEPAKVCSAWHPLPGGFLRNYLAASVICLSQISKAHGFDDCCLILDNLAWDYEDELLFEDCRKNKHDCRKEPQRLVELKEQKSPRKKVQPGYYSPQILYEGAVVFANIRSWSQKVLEIKEEWHTLRER